MNGRIARWTSFVAVLLCGLFVGVGLAFAEVQPESGFGLPRDVSLDGWRIDWLIQVTTIFVGILFFIMCVWMVYACIVHNEDHEAVYDHGDGKPAVVYALTLSCVIFFVMDGNLFYNSIVDVEEAFWNFEGAESHPDALRIEVNARQWAWEGRYAGADGEFGTPYAQSPDDVVVLNHFRVPVGVPVILELASVDVIHAFYLPNLRTKIDVMPGMINKLWFQATETGDFDIGCAQHCGTHHYKMKGMLSVLPKDEFDAWHRMASQRAERTHDPKDKHAQWGWAWRKDR
jgi:cytochrome c oxidase subunit 2